MQQQDKGLSTANHRQATPLIALQLALTILLAGCAKQVAEDPYDPAKMDLKPAPAALSSERHTGPFASGVSLSLEAQLKPLDPAPVKTIQLDTTHKIIEIA